MALRGPGLVPWGSFCIDGGDKGCGRIILEQIDPKRFALSCTISYQGETGLEGRIPEAALEAIRVVRPGQLAETDLASVPMVLQWFVGRYGVHTPAALIHDRLIGLDPPIDGVTDKLADRYFRCMLDDLGVPFIQRWLMWAAVAFRTRWVGGRTDRYLLGAWLVLALIGIVTFGYGVVTANWLFVAGAGLAPFVLSGLWWRQYAAGLVAAYFAVPWVLPPTVFATAFYGLYRVAEWAVRPIDRAWKAYRLRLGRSFR